MIVAQKSNWKNSDDGAHTGTDRTKVRHHGKIVFDHESIARNGLG